MAASPGRVRKEKKDVFTSDSPSSHLVSIWAGWTACDCHEGFSGFHIRSPGSPKGLPVILDYPWCASLETPHSSSLVSTSMRKEKREPMSQLEGILRISVSPGENNRGRPGTVERSKVCRVSVSWEHAHFWTSPKCLVDLFDR